MQTFAHSPMRFVAACLGLILSGCGSIELRNPSAPIEVIDNNFDGYYDTEVVWEQQLPPSAARVRELPAA